MPRNGRRHRLYLYTYMLDRLWKYTLGIGAAMLALAAGLAILPIQFQQFNIPWVSDRVLWVTAGAGAYALGLTIFLVSIRKLAYVQPFADHLRLITPFLRMDISYRRILKASSVEMQHLFPFGKSKGWKQKILRPLASQTAIVLDLKGWPLPRSLLGLFLSPFFFPDKTSRLALLVPKWMDFSMDMESFRSTWLDSLHDPDRTPQSALLASISRPRK
jgi:hypothetical protein